VHRYTCKLRKVRLMVTKQRLGLGLIKYTSDAAADISCCFTELDPCVAAKRARRAPCIDHTKRVGPLMHELKDKGRDYAA